MNSESSSCDSAESNSNSDSSTPEGEDQEIIDKILGEMKSQFNKSDRESAAPQGDAIPQAVTTQLPADLDQSSPANLLPKIDVAPEAPDKTEDSTNDVPTPPEALSPSDDSEEKPRIVLTLFKKPTTEPLVKPKPAETATGRRSQRQKGAPGYEKTTEEAILKRSARRRSKDCNESVLQSAIARKEKSYNETSKPQRLTRQLKPTQKILENLALAKQEKFKSGDKTSRKVDRLQKNAEGGGLVEANDGAERLSLKRIRNHSSKHGGKKVLKKQRNSHLTDSGRDSDSDQSVEQEDVVLKNKSGFDVGHRRAIRKSSSSSRSDPNADIDEHVTAESLGVVHQPTFCPAFPTNAEVIASRLCLCIQSTNYYLDLKNEEEITYCTAVDNINEKMIGCTRIIEDKEIMMLRPSTRVPYAVLCETHRNRLIRHNCCPICGTFCTQGRFVECEEKHQFHRNCQVSVGNAQCCPHCGLSTPDYDVVITMHSSKKPVFLPSQNVQYTSAKMTFQSSFKTDEELKCVTPPLLPIGALELLSSTQSRNEVYNVNDIIAATKNASVEKVAIILGSKIEDIYAKIPECNEGTVLHYAAKCGQASIVHMLLVAGLQADVFDKDQNTPLMLAILCGKNDVVQYLIRAGASIELKGTDGMTALHLAAKCGNIQACELLLSASTGIKNFVDSLDDGGWTPLVWACEHGYSDVANFLIQKGADPSIRDVEHNVALHWAAFSGSSHIAELLLNKGCSVNAVNAHGDTPLHIGARQDMYNCVIVLLARGANVTLLNKNNESPLDCAPPDGDCYSPISLNISMQATADYECQDVILANDISKGKETNPVQCFNNVDNDSNPVNFKYVTKNCISSNDVKIDTKITSLQSCNCEERCVDGDCICGKLSLKCWYDEEGKLISDFSFTDIPMIFECNDACSCNLITCNNRVVQKGLTQRFELFKTAEKGWGIRTLRLIPKGSFVCEYVGEIVTDSEADRRDDDSFVFDLENRVCKNITESEGYCIDAKFYGNFARFINHSCNPNLTSVKVFIDHQDLRFPRIAFFANRDIAHNEELSFDYGEKFWMAKCKSFTCLCGSLECKYSEDTIDSTVQNYQRRMLEDAS